MKVENIEKVRQILEKIQWLEMDKKCLQGIKSKKVSQITMVTFHAKPNDNTFTIPVSKTFSDRLIGLEESCLDEEIEALKKELEEL